MRTAKLAIAIFGILVGYTAILNAQDRVPWQNDIRQAQQLAAQRGQLVLIHFYGDNCPPCSWLENHVFNRAEVIRALTTSYVPVKVNCDQQTGTADRFSVESMPTDVIITPDGRELHRNHQIQAANKYISYLDQVAASYRVGHNPAAGGGGRPSPRNEAQASIANSIPAYGAPPMSNNAYNTVGGNSDPSNQVANRRDSEFRPPVQTSDAHLRNPMQQLPDATSTQAPAGPAPRYANPYMPVSDRGQFPSRDQAPPNGPELVADAKKASSDWNAVSGNSSNWVAPTPSIQSGLPARTPPLIIEGYCPVSLIDRAEPAWIKGDAKYGATHRGRTYLFAGQAERQKFLSNPERFAPALAGFDAVRYIETGELIEGKPDHGSLLEDRIYLFADEASQVRFEQNPHPYSSRVRETERQNDPVVARQP